MAPASLVLDVTVAFATAVLFAYVGLLMTRRPVSDPNGRVAVRAFSVWWYGLAIYTLMGGFRVGLALLGIVDPWVHHVVNSLTALPLVALLWGLVYYLTYIYTGNARLLWPISALHVAILVFYGYVVFSLQPVGLNITDWSAPIEYAGGVGPRMQGAILLTMLGPTLFAALAYVTLFFRARDPTTRFRIAMTSGAFIFWFGTAAIASLTPLGEWYWWPLAARVTGLVATLMVLAAYRPPRWLQQRFGIQPLETPRAALRDQVKVRLAYLRRPAL